MSAMKRNQSVATIATRPRKALASFLAASCLAMLLPLASPLASESKPGKVLVVMSYDEHNDSEIEIAQGINETLTGPRLRYVYLDAKNHLEQAAANAKKAYAVFQEFQPDIVISADDTAQEVFVLPYLQGKTSTPVVFCGVNDSASQYGFPNAQVTGIVEKKHYRQSIDFAQLIDPGIKKIAVIYRDTPANEINLDQITREEKDYGVTISTIVDVTSSAELVATLHRLEHTVDALLVLNLAGILGPSGETMKQNAAMALAAQTWTKASIGASKNDIEQGILCGVAKVNLEQGQVAGRMAKEILLGKTPAEIPATENKNGQRIINASTASRLGIKLKPMVLIGTTLVR